jgi:hypothetical protein
MNECGFLLNLCGSYLLVLFICLLWSLLFSCSITCFYLRNVCLKELFCRFVKVEKIRDQLLECNKQTYWVPDYVKVLYLFLFVTQSN